MNADQCDDSKLLSPSHTHKAEEKAHVPITLNAVILSSVGQREITIGIIGLSDALFE